MNRVRLTAAATILFAAAWMSFADHAEAMRGASMCIVLEPGLARRARLSSSDVSADLCDEGLGIFVATLPEAGAGKPATKLTTSVPQVGALDQAIRTTAAVRATSACKSGLPARPVLVAAMAANRSPRCPVLSATIRTISTSGTRTGMSRDISVEYCTLFNERPTRSLTSAGGGSGCPDKGEECSLQSRHLAISLGPDPQSLWPSDRQACGERPLH